MKKNQISEKEKKQITEDVKARIGKGEPKQQILEELTQVYKDKVTIVQQLETTPSLAMKQKYRMHNYMLAIFLMAALIADIFTLWLDWGKWIIIFPSMLNVVLDVIFVVGVLLYRSEIYSWISSRAVVSLVMIIATLYYYSIGTLNPLIYISLGLVIISFILGMILGIKLCPQRVPKTIEVDIDGTEKINKTIYVFAD